MNANIHAIALSHVVADEADVRAELEQTRHERDILSAAWHVAIHEHHDVLRERDSLRQQLAQLRDEHRFLRESEMRKGLAA